MISTLKKKLNKKGFTLAELLVVVAIIAILVAIAIPVFSSSTKNAKIQADSANVRSWYAEETVKFLTAQGGDSDVTPAAFPVAVNEYLFLAALFVFNFAMSFPSLNFYIYSTAICSFHAIYIRTNIDNLITLF